ncbi:MAG: hypothetical protein JRG86_01355 [Deltaproteobacteria bacterium]|jgi:hypothetical protein|nr:hypothetical protein [Deltaproteobacteria bacterium]MBW2497411.1 hypothetical protein [Deltaproteobacteria bacterium]
MATFNDKDQDGQGHANNFGGTLSIMRFMRNTVWCVLVQPGEDGFAEVRRNWQDLVGRSFTPGPPNFQYHANAANRGPRIRATLNPNGAVNATFGCVDAWAPWAAVSSAVLGMAQGRPRRP